jgi:hypothetical protein
MITIILVVLLFIVWIIGGGIASLIAGWDPSNVSDLLKIIFWPISLFFEK